MTLIVSRYRDDPAVLMWQVMNEAETVTRLGFERPDAVLAFAEEMGALIKAIDRRHLLAFGTNTVDRPGSGGSAFVAIASLEAYDLVEAHDYGDEYEALPDDVRQALAVAQAVGKPFFIGEVGICSPPIARARRAALTRDKLEAAWAADVDGQLIWSYRAGDGTNRDFDADDPLSEAVRSFTASHPVR